MQFIHSHPDKKTEYENSIRNPMGFDSNGRASGIDDVSALNERCMPSNMSSFPDAYGLTREINDYAI